METFPHIPVLFTCRSSPYLALPFCDCWDARRDATTYSEGLPVIAHPPCARWGKFASYDGHTPGDDGGLGDFAVETVRRFGGILEHPAHSGLFARHFMPQPRTGLDLWGGFTVEVNQSAYGHRALKPTWLYCVGVDPSYPWRLGRGAPTKSIPDLGKAERERTPISLAHELVLAFQTINTDLPLPGYACREVLSA